jgi:archaellum biogenesis ATPase FlaH
MRWVFLISRGCRINEYLTDLFGDQNGIVYSPVKKGDHFKQYFFDWPQERDKLERHLDDYGDRDVYISPVLFNERRIAPETFRGTNYLWTEFDGTIPQSTIEPTIRVSSSIEGHEHWYWKLDHFVTDKVQIEDLTRRIAYHYGADLSVWDYQNVLRPVDTWNHKRNRPVTLLTKTDKVYTINDFLWVPIPPAGSKVDVKLGSLPDRDTILAKYKWTYDALDLLFKNQIEKGKRSDALVRLAFECIELGLSNEETYVLINERDNVWGKFVGRNDKQKQLECIIAHVRRKKATVAEIVQGAPEVYRFHDFMKTNIKLKWAIEGLLPVAGSMVIFGKPGIGKSTFSLRMAIDLALGRDKFLVWNIANKQRVLFISLEMQHYELKEFFEDMKLTEEENEGLQEQFFIWPIGSAYPFDTPDQQIELLKYIKLHKIELIIIDSLSLSMYGSVKNDDDIKRLNSFLNEDVRRDNKCGYVFIHHPRKRGSEDANKDSEQDDAFGSMYITANAQTMMSLTSKPGSNTLHIKMLKRRHATGPADFYIERTPNRGFQLVGSTVSTEQAPANKSPNAGSLGKLLNL